MIKKQKVFDTIAPRFSDRPGGYSRIVRLGPRVGDGGDVAVIELLGSELEAKKAKDSEAAAKEKDESEASKTKEAAESEDSEAK